MKEEDQKDTKKKVETEEFIELGVLKNQDVKSKFEFWCNYISSDPIKRYDAICKAIFHGKELLPMDLKDETEQEKVNEVYKNACKVLKEEIPKQRHSRYGYFDEGGKRHLMIKINSTDAGECTTPEAEYKNTLSDFILQQYEQHMGNLKDALNNLYHMLVKYKKIELEDKPPNELLQDWMKEEIKKAKDELTNKNKKGSVDNGK